MYTLDNSWKEKIFEKLVAVKIFKKKDMLESI